MEPKNEGFEDDFPFQPKGWFSVSMLIFWGVPVPYNLYLTTWEFSISELFAPYKLEESLPYWPIHDVIIRDTLISATCFHHGLEVTSGLPSSTEMRKNRGFLDQWILENTFLLQYQIAPAVKKRKTLFEISTKSINESGWGATSNYSTTAALIQGSFPLQFTQNTRTSSANQILKSHEIRYHHSTTHFWKKNNKSRSHTTKVVSTWDKSSLSHCQKATKVWGSTWTYTGSQRLKD